MARPDPIQYAERLYGAIRAANFSPISFLAFGNAIKDGVSMRNMPRIAAEPFMRVVGEMLDLEEEIENHKVMEASIVDQLNGTLEGDAPALSPSERPAPDSPAIVEGNASNPPPAPTIGKGRRRS